MSAWTYNPLSTSSIHPAIAARTGRVYDLRFRHPIREDKSMRSLALPATAICAVLGVQAARAQRGGDWMTGGYDPQRSSWVRSDGKISRQSLQKPGFDLVWKLKFANSPRQLNTLTPPALLEFYIGYRG